MIRKRKRKKGINEERQRVGRNIYDSVRRSMIQSSERGLRRQNRKS